MTKRIVVVDDVKEFPFPEDVEVTYCRDLLSAALELLTDRRIDQLWLDHDLGGDEEIQEIRPLVRAILDRNHNSIPVPIGLVVVCSLNAYGANWIADSLGPWYPVVRCVDNRDVADVIGVDEGKVKWY